MLPGYYFKGKSENIQTLNPKKEINTEEDDPQYFNVQEAEHKWMDPNSLYSSAET